LAAHPGLRKERASAASSVSVVETERNLNTLELIYNYMSSYLEEKFETLVKEFLRSYREFPEELKDLQVKHLTYQQNDESYRKVKDFGENTVEDDKRVAGKLFTIKAKRLFSLADELITLEQIIFGGSTLYNINNEVTLKQFAEYISKYENGIPKV
jgi:hypothetical protein